MNTPVNNFEKGQKLGARHLKQFNDMMSTAMASPSGLHRTTRGIMFPRRPAPRRQACLESECGSGDAFTGGDTGYITLAPFTGFRKNTSTAIFALEDSNQTIRVLCPGLFLFIFRFGVYWNESTIPDYASERVTFTAKTVSSGASISSLPWQANASFVYPGDHDDGATPPVGHTHGGAVAAEILTHNGAWDWGVMGSISFIADSQSQLVDGGFKVHYNYDRYNASPTLSMNTNDSNITIIGPLL